MAQLTVEAANGDRVDPEADFYIAKGTSGADRTLHTDHGCYRLKIAKTVSGTDADATREEWSLCTACEGEEDVSGSKDLSYQRALRAAARDD